MEALLIQAEGLVDMLKDGLSRYQQQSELGIKELRKVFEDMRDIARSL